MQAPRLAQENGCDPGSRRHGEPVSPTPCRGYWKLLPAPLFRPSEGRTNMKHSFLRIALAASLAALPAAPPAIAQHAHAPLPAAATELHPGLGDHHFAITTSNAEAQSYFDHGIRLLYGFNHDEAA